MIDREEQRAILNGETAQVSWTELERHFARGVVVEVRNPVNLLDAAMALATNDTVLVKAWMAQGDMGPVEAAQAKSWLERDPALWSVVVAPWVLVQERTVD